MLHFTIRPLSLNINFSPNCLQYRICNITFNSILLAIVRLFSRRLFEYFQSFFGNLIKDNIPIQHIGKNFVCTIVLLYPLGNAATEPSQNANWKLYELFMMSTICSSAIGFNACQL